MVSAAMALRPASATTSAMASMCSAPTCSREVVGIGKFQVLGKYAKATYEFDVGSDVDQDTIEVNLNYIIKASTRA